MPRSLRVFAEGAMYHVYSRVTGRQRVFEEAAAAGDFVAVLREVRARDRFLLYAWCVLPRHYHLLLRTTDVPLWRSMASVQGSFSKRYNRRLGLVGPLWQGRYKAKLVEDQRYFDQLVAYVHLNPVVAGLVGDPAGWRWSGHRELLGKVRNPLVDVDETLRGFGLERRAARAAYRRALAGAEQGGWLGAEPGRLPWWRFGATLREGTSLQARSEVPFVTEPGRSTGRERPRLEPQELLAGVCEALGVTAEEVASSTEVRRVVRAREMTALLAVERYGVRAKDVAAVVGKNADTVSRWLQRGSLRRRKDGDFGAAVERVDDKLSAPEAQPGSGQSRVPAVTCQVGVPATPAPLHSASCDSTGIDPS